MKIFFIFHNYIKRHGEPHSVFYGYKKRKLFADHHRRRGPGSFKENEKIHKKK